MEEQLIKSCLEGDKRSLEKLIKSIDQLVYNLSIRFLWNKADAEDATQEILLKVITNLSKYQGKSKFNTWVYRIATNYLINQKKTSFEKRPISFSQFSEELNSINDPVSYDLPDSGLLEKEMKTGCTLAMLQCLSRELRIVFILGSILKIKSNVACEIIEISPENFRKRLQKSRKLIGSFLNSNCGVYNIANKCRCNKRIHIAIASKRIVKGDLNFVDNIDVYNEEMEELNSMTGIYSNHGDFINKSDFYKELNQLIASKRIFNEI
ncbi:RNA polymerase sigma factor [Aquimarina sp. AD1]|uniref:RNA polymerase sigma factor n=1 Tax=Aquimarina sp. (strain AD1) TaxID=1714848 RepID=UPI000E50226C|nr:RNA polymerase sigma factor [Aquimarina sp. AD1]AXT58382.1 RNA polymerase sigma factor [Aquimarina sp. AD1]